MGALLLAIKVVCIVLEGIENRWQLNIAAHVTRDHKYYHGVLPWPSDETLVSP